MKALALALTLTLTLGAPADAQENGTTEDAPRASAVGRCVSAGNEVICSKRAFAGLLNEIDTARTSLALQMGALEVCRRNRADERESYQSARAMETGGCEKALDIAWKAFDPPGFLDRWLPTIAFVVGVIVGGGAVAIVVDALHP